MKKIKFLSGFFALVAVALATTFTACEKEEVNIVVEPVNAKAEVSPVVLLVENGTISDVTAVATISYDKTLPIIGNPEIAATTVKVTAAYKGVSTSVVVNIPALTEGQFVTLTPTILLQNDINYVIKDVEVEGEEEEVADEKYEDNPTMFWYYTKVTYFEKSGVKLAAEVEYEDGISLSDKAAAESYFAGLADTYKSVEKVEDKVKVYAMSRTTAKYSYTTQSVKYQVVKAVEGEETGEVLATMTAEVYANTTLEIIDNQVIPGHGHNHTHGHGHGHGHGADNAGGGIVFAD